MTTDELNVALFGTKLSNVGDGDVEKEPMFRIGDCVIRVRSYCQDNSIEWRRPHIRVPGYIYGACGVVERVCDEYQDPSFLAFMVCMHREFDCIGYDF